MQLLTRPDKEWSCGSFSGTLSNSFCLLHEILFSPQLSCAMPDDVQGFLLQPAHDRAGKNGWSSQLQNLEFEGRIDLTSVDDRRLKSVRRRERPETTRIFKERQTCNNLWRWDLQKDFKAQISTKGFIHVTSPCSRMCTLTYTMHLNCLPRLRFVLKAMAAKAKDWRLTKVRWSSYWSTWW